MTHGIPTVRPSLLPAAGIAAMSLSAPSSVIIHQGWVLKKRRKKMQGFARRYFILFQSGLLCYSFEPGQPIRDQISLHTAAVSTAPGRKDIHIDSNLATFHLKCLSTEDFNQWMSALRQFIGNGPQSRRSTSIRVTSRQNTLKYTKTGLILDEMAATLDDLERAIKSLSVDAAPSKRSSKTRSDKDKPKETSTMFGLFKRGAENATAPSSISETFEAALASLRLQHSALVKCTLDATHFTSLTSPLPFTAEEEEHADEQQTITQSPIRGAHRASLATTISESLHDWFDASDSLEGAQEFTLDVGLENEPSRMTVNDSRSSLHDDDASSVDTDIQVSSPVDTAPEHFPHVMRRTLLPAPSVGDEGSLFAILKKNIGKDLASIAFPVTFNEPLTLLQRSAEELEYFELLSTAASCSDPLDRMRFVAAFAVSGYAHTRHRTGRKGFNPMLGETFEDPRMKFIAEKVCHNPLEIAYRAEGRNWELEATSAGKTKFWGKSLEIIPLGMTHVRIGDDHFEWRKPSSFMRNLVVGTKYLEHCGKMTIENTTNKHRCILDFKESGYWAASNAVSGIIFDADGNQLSRMEGKWDDQFAHTVDSTHLRILWRVSPWPKNTQEYYGFTAFTMTLNEITPDLANKLPVTDSRNRPDVRALENGDLVTAENEKQRLEEAQRERRKNGNNRQPRWFKRVGEEWSYVGGYWEARSKGWKGQDIQSLW